MSNVNDIGTIIKLDTAADITNASSVSIKVKKPNGTIVEWVAEVEGTKLIRYITKAGDLDLPGTYKMQSHVVMPGFTGSGEVIALVVDRNVDTI